MGWNVFAGIAFLGLGALLFFKPDLFWKLTESWKSDRADGPSDLYRKSAKLGGALLALLGAAIAVLALAAGA